MMDLAAFKTKCGVTKTKYIKDWIDNDLIPGVKKGPSIEDTRFPDAARRPYHDRSKIKPTTPATDIRAHIVKACIDKEHITNKMCYMSQDEFKAAINDLVKCGLITIRTEEGIEYYDSTSKCDELVKERYKAIRQFVLDALGKVVENTVKEIKKT